MDAVIPVGGLGTRLQPLTRAVPKEMLPIVDKPVVQYVVEELASAGIKRILLVTSPRKQAIKEYFETEPVRGVRIEYALQPEPRGLGDALARAEEFANGHPVLVAHGDVLIEPGGIAGRLAEAYERSGASAVLAVAQVPDDAVSKCGIIVPGDRPEVEDVIEKPRPERVTSRTGAMGRYVLAPEMFAVLAETPVDETGEVGLATALRRAIASGRHVLAVPLGAGERRHDAGSLEGYCQTFIEYALRDPRITVRRSSG